MQDFLSRTVEINNVLQARIGSGLDFKTAAVLIPCVQGLKGGHSCLIHSASELKALGLDDDVEVDIGTTDEPNKIMVPNAVKSFVESFFRENRNGALQLVRICPKGGGFRTVNPGGQVQHDVIIDVLGTKYKTTTKGTSTAKDEAAISGALVTALASTKVIKSSVSFTTKNNGDKYTVVEEKNGNTKYNWFLDLSQSTNIKPYNVKSILDEGKCAEILEVAEALSSSFYMFSVITEYTPVVKPVEATWTKNVDKILKWTQERDGRVKAPKVHILDVPQPLVIDSGWKTKAEAKIDSGLYSRTSWYANPDHLYDNVAAKILAKHADTNNPGQRPFLRSVIYMASGYRKSSNTMTKYADYEAQFLGYIGMLQKQYGLNGGRTMTGYQLQHLIGEDVIKDALVVQILNLLYSDNPLKFSYGDLNRLKVELIRNLKEHQSNGVLAPDLENEKAYSVEIPNLDSVPEEEKRKGLLKNVQVGVKLTGGIEKIIITFNSTLQ